jgi:hypothetical protein
MNNADSAATNKHTDRKPLIAISREAVQTAEDARAIAVKKMDDVRLANERSRQPTHRREPKKRRMKRHGARSKLSPIPESDCKCEIEQL